MTLPLKNRIYEYKGKNVILYHQEIFSKVFIKTIPNLSGGSTYYWENWWIFMLKATLIKVN